MGIFKACDIRGVYGDDLTDAVAYRIGRALGTILSGGSVLVGGDLRVSTPALRSALTDGLVAAGSRVVDIGSVPTPAFYFAKRLLGVASGVMITASHNPPKFNGFKVTLNDLPITEEELRGLAGVVESGAFTDGVGSVERADVMAAYREYLLEIAPSVGDASTLPLVVDCGNGAYSGIAAELLADRGFPVSRLFCEPDGSFPNRSPNSADPRALGALRRLVVESGARLGIAFDGDGDRVSFVDELGRFLTIDKGIVILTRSLLADTPGAAVVHDLKCSSVVSEAIAESGGRAIPERSGHTFIKRRMIAEDAVFGGELSGHYFYRSLHGGDDGLYTALTMANIVLRSGGSLAGLADSVPEYVTTPDLRIGLDGDLAGVIERIAADLPPACVSRLDGVRADFGDGWGLARASVTEPVVTLRFEARTRERLDEIVNRFLRSVPQALRLVEERIAWDAATADGRKPVESLSNIT